MGCCCLQSLWGVGTPGAALAFWLETAAFSTEEYSCLIMDAYQTHTSSTIWKHFSKIPIFAQLDGQKHICSYMQMSFRVWWRPFAGSKVKPKSLWLPLLPRAATTRSKSVGETGNQVVQDFSTNQRRSLTKFGSDNHDKHEFILATLAYKKSDKSMKVIGNNLWMPAFFIDENDESLKEF